MYKNGTKLDHVINMTRPCALCFRHSLFCEVFDFLWRREKNKIDKYRFDVSKRPTAFHIGKITPAVFKVQPRARAHRQMLTRALYRRSTDWLENFHNETTAKNITHFLPKTNRKGIKVKRANCRLRLRSVRPIGRGFDAGFYFCIFSVTIYSNVFENDQVSSRVSFDICKFILIDAYEKQYSTK